jgi:ribonuclease P protein component
MLPVKNRLKKRSDFAKVYRKGLFSSENPVSIKFSENGLEKSRIGFSIEKKFFKKAVERNRIKRILREAFHKNLGNIKAGFDIVVFYKKSEKDSDFKKVIELVEKVIKKSGLFEK